MLVPLVRGTASCVFLLDGRGNARYWRPCSQCVLQGLSHTATRSSSVCVLGRVRYWDMLRVESAVQYAGMASVLSRSLSAVRGTSIGYAATSVGTDMPYAANRRSQPAYRGRGIITYRPSLSLCAVLY